MKDRYTEGIHKAIDEIVPGASNRLEDIDRIELEQARQIAGKILLFANCAQNDGYINMGRREFRRLPKAWVDAHLPGIVDEVLNLSDEWEYLRLLELLCQAGSPLFMKYRALGLASSNPEIREAASDAAAWKLGDWGVRN